MAKAERAPRHYDAGTYILCCSSAPVPGPLMAPRSLQHLSPPDPAPVASAAVRINSHFVLQPLRALSTSRALYLVIPGGTLSFPLCQSPPPGLSALGARFSSTGRPLELQHNQALLGRAPWGALPRTVPAGEAPPTAGPTHDRPRPQPAPPTAGSREFWKGAGKDGTEGPPRWRCSMGKARSVSASGKFPANLRTPEDAWHES